jgi:hypothetical protein
MNLDLTDEEAAALIRLLRGTIDGDRYPLSPASRRGKRSRKRSSRCRVRAPLQPNVYARARMLGAGDEWPIPGRR